MPLHTAMAADCATDGSSATYSESIVGQARVITTSGCPNHYSVAIGPNTATDQSRSVSIPATPQLPAGGPSSLASFGGTVGVALNGVSIYSCFSGPFACANAPTGAPALEGDTFDKCGGHASAGGDYHYQIPPTCLHNQIGTLPDGHSPQIGWMYDGFPVYGPFGPGGVPMLRCGVSGADPTYCVDECGGWEGELPGVDEVKYRYYMLGELSDEFTNPVSPLSAEMKWFPYSPYCMRGCCPVGVSCPGIVPTCIGAAAGTTAVYTPTALGGVTDPYTTPPYGTQSGTCCDDGPGTQSECIVATETDCILGGGMFLGGAECTDTLDCVALQVTLESLSAHGTGGHVLVRWATISEIDAVGFRVLRESPQGRVKSLQAVSPVIPSSGTSLEGASYEFLDDSKGASSADYYYIEDIDVFGRRTTHGPVRVQRGRQVPDDASLRTRPSGRR